MQFHKHSIVMKALVSIQTEKTLYHSYWWLVSRNYLKGANRDRERRIQYNSIKDWGIHMRENKAR